MSAQGERLRRLISEFTAAEAKKEIRWSVNKGVAPPSEEAVQAELKLEESLQRKAAAEMRSEDRQRQELETDNSVVIPMSEMTSVDDINITFDPTPSDKLESRNRLLSMVVLAGRIHLQRNRIDSRLKKALQSRTGKTHRTLNRCLQNIGTVLSLELPVPAVNVVGLRSGTLPDQGFEEPGFFDECPIRDYLPFDFKINELQQHHIHEHSYLNAEPSQSIDLDRPGEYTEDELSSSQLCDMSGFMPVPNWELHFDTVRKPYLLQPSMGKFSYVHLQPDCKLVYPHQDLKCDNLQLVGKNSRNTMRTRTTFQKPIPELLSQRQPEDEMSDPEDDSEEVEWEIPSSIKLVSNYDWLPNLSDLITDNDDLKPTLLPVATHDNVVINTQIKEGLLRYEEHVKTLLDPLPLKLRKRV